MESGYVPDIGNEVERHISRAEVEEVRLERLALFDMLEDEDITAVMMLPQCVVSLHCDVPLLRGWPPACRSHCFVFP